jgi:hypothetical protein
MFMETKHLCFKNGHFITAMIPYSKMFRTIPGFDNKGGGSKMIDVRSVSECTTKCIPQEMCAAFSYSAKKMNASSTL